jgi:hypothetical protein
MCVRAEILDREKLSVDSMTLSSYRAIAISLGLRRAIFIAVLIKTKASTQIINSPANKKSIILDAARVATIDPKRKKL